MEFGLSEEQTLLEESIGRYLKENGTLDRTRRFADDGELRADDVWKGLCDLGVPGLLIGEEHGGIGLDLPLPKSIKGASFFNGIGSRSRDGATALTSSWMRNCSAIIFASPNCPASAIFSLMTSSIIS